MKKLSKKQILMLHTQLIQQTGGSEGVRDYNLLDSALETSFQSFGGDELYPTIQAKAARLGYGLIKNHCMIDGNKRIKRLSLLTRDRFKFCVNVKTDIRFVNSYKWAEPIFRILPISALYSSF